MHTMRGTRRTIALCDISAGYKILLCACSFAVKWDAAICMLHGGVARLASRVACIAVCLHTASSVHIFLVGGLALG